MSEKFTDPQIMEHNIRNVMDHWTTITQDDLTNFFNALRADAWDEGANALEHHQMHVSGGWPTNPYRK